MKKVSVKNGDIVAIPLGKYGDGFGYAKYIDAIKEWGEELNLPGILRVFKYVTDSCETDIAKINKELLIAPIGLTGIKGASKFGWLVIGNQSITAEDRFLPYVKGGWPHIAPVPEKWLYYEELGNTLKQHFAEYETVKHLEKNRLLNIELVPFRIVMETLKLEGKDIKDQLKDLDWLEKAEYDASYNIPPYSLQLPSKRGRVM